MSQATVRVFQALGPGDGSLQLRAKERSEANLPQGCRGQREALLWSAGERPEQREVEQPTQGAELAAGPAPGQVDRSCRVPGSRCCCLEEVAVVREGSSRQEGRRRRSRDDGPGNRNFGRSQRGETDQLIWVE